MTPRQLYKKIAWLNRAREREASLIQAICDTESAIASYLAINGEKEIKIGSYEVRLDKDEFLRIDYKPPKPFVQLVMKEVLGEEVAAD